MQQIVGLCFGYNLTNPYAGAYESAAMTLVPQNDHRVDLHVNDDGRAAAWVRPRWVLDKPTWQPMCATPALALTAAALRAIAEEMDG